MSRDILEQAALASLELAKRDNVWKAFRGPQTLALESKADFLFYGGSAGGGKTDLILGLPRFRHYKSLILRRVFPSLSGIIDRSKEIYAKEGSGSLDNYNESKARWTFEDGRSIRFGSVQHEKDVTDYQGQAHDFYGFDEITEFSEKMFRFITGWNRSTIQGQRCRVVCTGNPPTNSDGDWIIQFWAPWLDENHPNPAKPGELRWFTTQAGVDVEVPSGDPIEINGEMVQPQSRTFIPAKVQDNPKLMESGYLAKLQALQEPLRSKLLYGDFRAGREDAAYQIIPSDWVVAAQKRWESMPEPTHIPITAIGVDVARGGADSTCLSVRRNNWFAKIKQIPGKDTPDGQSVAALAIINAKGNAMITVDVIGVGGSAYDFLKESGNVNVRPFNGASKSLKKDKSNQLNFVNRRAEAYWLFRELLDPANENNVSLPPDTELKADLCSPTYKIVRGGIQVESKDDIKKRIGRSPDKADALVMCALKIDLKEEEPKFDELGLPLGSRSHFGSNGWMAC